MTATVDARSMNRTFAKAIVVALVLLAQLGAVIHLLNDGHRRPEGIAERWLSAVSDTGRDGVRGDAVERAEEVGPVALAAALVPAGADGEHALFSDLEVGRARTEGATARVPYRVNQRDGEELTGEVVLVRAGGRADGHWRVTEVTTTPLADGVLPSDGGAPPSSAPFTLWLLAVAIGVVITALGSLLVHWAGPGVVTRRKVRRAGPSYS